MSIKETEFRTNSDNFSDFSGNVKFKLSCDGQKIIYAGSLINLTSFFAYGGGERSAMELYSQLSESDLSEEEAVHIKATIEYYKSENDWNEEDLAEMQKMYDVALKLPEDEFLIYRATIDENEYPDHCQCICCS